MDRIKTPKMLWEGFDPEALPLDVSEMATVSAGDLVEKSLYFTGETVGAGCTRVFAKVVAKATTTSKPALIIVGRPDKPISDSELRYWAGLGYVALGIDYRGFCEYGRYTIYPQALSYCNYTDDDFAVYGDAADTKWYHYAVSTMRAVTYLKSAFRITKVNILTVGKGSYIGLMAMAIDRRIDKGSIVFGNLNIRPEGYADLAKETNAAAMEEVVASNENLDIWLLGVAPQSYVPLIEAPLYVIAAGNSFEVDVKTLSATYVRTNDDSRLLILPDAFDYLSNNITAGISKWFKGAAVADDIEIEEGGVDPSNGALRIKLTASLAKDDTLELWYCTNGDNVGKNWQMATLTEVGGEFFADIDLFQEDSTVLLVGVKQSAVSVSSAILTVDTAGRKFATKTPTALLYNGETNFKFVPMSVSDEWHGVELQLATAKGYLGIRGTKGRAFATFALTDSSVLHEGKDTISFDVQCCERQTMNVYHVVNMGKTNDVFAAKVTLAGDGKWQKITLDHSEFKNVAGGYSLDKQAKVDICEFVADQKFIINNIYIV
jgi:hypothetical protein